MTPSERRVLVTRAPGSWPTLEARGIVFRRPTAATSPLDPAPLASAIAEAPTFSWIVFTSVTAVHRFAEELRGAGRDAGSLAAKVACVGPATARAAEGEGWRPAVVAPEGTGASLAREVAARSAPGESALVVRPETRSAFPAAILEGAGLRTTSVAAYRIVPTPEAAAIATDLAAGRFDAVVATAPSAAQAILDAPSGAAGLARVKRVAIGPTTASALERAGFPPHAVASEPTAEAVALALESLW